MVIWLIGMSASGKTTIGNKLFNKLIESDEQWLFLDGDTFRHILGEDLGHTVEDRRKNAYRISRFCEFLNSQNINVLACVLSIFHDNQRYNRENIKDYKEVFIDVNLNNLIKRDNKKLYQKALDRKIKNVVGIDIDFVPPYAPDIVVDNNEDNPDYDIIINRILNTFQISLSQNYTYTKKNLLEIPHKYQYSKFEGVEIFGKFSYDRQDSIRFFDKKLKKLKHIPLPEFFECEVYVQNNLILENLLINLFLSKKNKLLKSINLVKFLIKRFEVSKKLYLTYDKHSIRKSSSEYDNLLNYALFSLVLQRFYYFSESPQTLVFLNAILKVNDIISSIKIDMCLVEEIYYAKLALEGELKIVREII